ncbi:unnamed protein product, partial [Symbiodinium sp. CCMP2456]
MTWLQDYDWDAMSPADRQLVDDTRRKNRSHVGTRPDILREYATHRNFIENAKYVLNNIKDAQEAGIQQIAVHTVCVANRHRSVAGCVLIFDLVRRIEDASVSLTHMNAAHSWPYMGRQSCKGQCMYCRRGTTDIVNEVARLCDMFVDAVYTDGPIRENATLVVEPDSARPRRARTYAELFNEQQVALGNVEAPITGVGLLDQPPRPGETATQAATRMGLAGKTHTSYVAKFNPDSLTGAMNRTVNAPKGAPVPSVTFTTGMGPGSEAKSSGSKAPPATSPKVEAKARPLIAASDPAKAKAPSVSSATVRALAAQIKDLQDANHMLESAADDLRNALHDVRREMRRGKISTKHVEGPIVQKIALLGVPRDHTRDRDRRALSNPRERSEPPQAVHPDHPPPGHRAAGNPAMDGGGKAGGKGTRRLTPYDEVDDDEWENPGPPGPLRTPPASPEPPRFREPYDRYPNRNDPRRTLTRHEYFHDERDMWTDHDWARFHVENPRKPKAVNAIGHLFTCHEDPSVDSAWRYEGTCCPCGALPNSVPPEHGEEAEQQCPGTPPSAEGAHVILWLFPLVFAASTEPKGLEHHEDVDMEDVQEEEDDDDQAIVPVEADPDAAMAPATPSTVSATDPAPVPANAAEEPAVAAAADLGTAPELAVSPKEESAEND